MPERILDTHLKGLNVDPGTSVPELLAGTPSITDDVFSWPLLTLSEVALEHNIQTMASVCADAGVLHAPHVKTAMSQELYARQAGAGAWGATVATPAQLRAVRSWGSSPVMLANELTDPRELRWLREHLIGAARDGEPATVWHWVDSLCGVELARQALRPEGDPAPSGYGVLIELGVPGGRTGVRSAADALELARGLAAARIPLVGVAGYEGPLVDHDERPRAGRVIEYVRALRDLAEAIDRENLWGPGIGTDGLAPVVTVGGSDVIDVILSELGEVDGRMPIRGVIRSGASLTHDHGLCARANPWQHLGLALQPAAVVWASVLSTPEEGLALLNAGRRDVPFDIDLPVPLHVLGLAETGAWAGPGPIEGWQVTTLNDQHAYLRTTNGTSTPLSPGDVVGLGISHPCTLFDKWRTAVVVDDQLRAVDLITTQF
ncbi:alanine racemase [Ruania alba]|uniref:D-serine deaminase, pyridoxal phosphate-dependent n=1 Tax=Ruania alba TaxID=648782 RepID=A0A1H5NET0_9MICO|nr:alanine racemase [Ruania alba]SEE99980.1 D-serine deaminase, pyridoxal phosphate-dependent [Ruania alba]